TDAQTQQHPVPALGRNPLGNIRKIALPNLKTPGEFGQSLLCRLNGGAIAIASKQPSSRRTRGQNGCRVSSPSERQIRVAAPDPWPERFQHFGQHDRSVGEFERHALVLVSLAL